MIPVLQLQPAPLPASTPPPVAQAATHPPAAHPNCRQNLREQALHALEHSLLPWVHERARRICAFANKNYQEKGRGCVVFMFQTVQEVFEEGWSETSLRYLSETQVHALAMKTNHILSALERYNPSRHCVVVALIAEIAFDRFYFLRADGKSSHSRKAAQAGLGFRYKQIENENEAAQDYTFSDRDCSEKNESEISSTVAETEQGRQGSSCNKDPPTPPIAIPPKHLLPPCVSATSRPWGVSVNTSIGRGKGENRPSAATTGFLASRQSASNNYVAAAHLHGQNHPVGSTNVICSSSRCRGGLHNSSRGGTTGGQLQKASQQNNIQVTTAHSNGRRSVCSNNTSSSNGLLYPSSSSPARQQENFDHKRLSTTTSGLEDETLSTTCVVTTQQSRQSPSLELHEYNNNVGTTVVTTATTVGGVTDFVLPSASSAGTIDFDIAGPAAGTTAAAAGAVGNNFNLAGVPPPSSVGLCDRGGQLLHSQTEYDAYFSTHNQYNQQNNKKRSWAGMQNNHYNRAAALAAEQQNSRMCASNYLNYCNYLNYTKQMQQALHGLNLALASSSCVPTARPLLAPVVPLASAVVPQPVPAWLPQAAVSMNMLGAPIGHGGNPQGGMQPSPCWATGASTSHGVLMQ
ncbi:unnamed protein product [Amoebophrya sp. A120]|nr:unnamed protein product [Amoebophrya sp. A120]|eukprot:GSA120T00002744001.1